MSRGRLIHVMGTQSNAGKTTIAMALCRIYNDLGFSVAPFKALNMSLNSIATISGDEISRSQWLQAKASKVELDWRNNPILLKPEGSGHSQVIFKGKSIGVKSISDYGKFLKSDARDEVLNAADNLLEEFDIVIAEGSGSAAEINLYDRDLANTWLTKKLSGTGILVGNIENGGIFSSLYGTQSLAEFPEVLKYFIINNMRGNSELLQPGIAKVEELTKMKSLGIVKHFENILPGEDSMDYDKINGARVGIVRYPYFENYSDIDPLRVMKLGRYVTKPEDLMDLNALVLPGSKNVSEDLKFLKSSGLHSGIMDFYKRGGKIIGICGGYQILSRKLFDPHSVQLYQKEVDGLGILDVDFKYEKSKKVSQVYYEGKLNEIKFKGIGYEIHYGDIVRNGEESLFDDRYASGSISNQRNVIGTNVHGILENEVIFHWLTGIKPKLSYEKDLDNRIQQVSDHILGSLKREYIIALANGI